LEGGDVEYPNLVSRLPVMVGLQLTWAAAELWPGYAD